MADSRETPSSEPLEVTVGGKFYVKKDGNLNILNRAVQARGGLPIGAGYLIEILAVTKDDEGPIAEFKITPPSSFEGNTYGENRWVRTSEIHAGKFGIDTRDPDGGNLESMDTKRAGELLDPEGCKVREGDTPPQVQKVCAVAHKRVSDTI